MGWCGPPHASPAPPPSGNYPCPVWPKWHWSALHGQDPPPLCRPLPPSRVASPTPPTPTPTPLGPSFGSAAVCAWLRPSPAAAAVAMPAAAPKADARAGSGPCSGEALEPAAAAAAVAPAALCGLTPKPSGEPPRLPSVGPAAATGVVGSPGSPSTACCDVSGWRRRRGGRGPGTVARLQRGCFVAPTDATMQADKPGRHVHVHSRSDRTGTLRYTAATLPYHMRPTSCITAATPSHLRRCWTC